MGFARLPDAPPDEIIQFSEDAMLDMAEGRAFLLELTRGQKSVVDADDFKYLRHWNWCAYKGARTWYAVRRGMIEKKFSGMIHLHRFIMEPPPDMVVDHKNGNGLDNRKSNLRVCTQAQNNKNKCKRTDGKTSKYIGVIKSPHTPGAWSASISIHRKSAFLGYYTSEDRAAQAYDSAAYLIHGEYARLNLPEMLTKRESLEDVRKESDWFRRTPSGAGYRGVHRCSDGTYLACVYLPKAFGKKCIRKFGFQSPRDAAIVYDLMARVVGKRKELLNFPSLRFNAKIGIKDLCQA